MNLTAHTVEFSIHDVDGLRTRLRATRWPAQLVDDWTHGMPLAIARQLVAQWADTDFEEMKGQLNSVSHAITEIDGQRFHVAHASRRGGAGIPLLIAHGYPSCFAEYLPLMRELADKGFDVVVPSLPGFGFSTPLTAGWGLPRIAGAFDAIMTGLGHSRYGIVAGDVGAGVAAEIGLLAGDRLIGSLFFTDPGELGTPYTPPAPHLDSAEADRLAAIAEGRAEDFGYLAIQQTRPQSVAFGLSDSPVMQLAWIVEKFFEWSDPSDRQSLLEQSRTLLLTIASVYWFGGGGAGAAELLWTIAHSPASWGQRGDQPVGYAAFGEEPLQRRVLDPAGTAFWRSHPSGGHFPAITATAALGSDVVDFFRQIRGR